VATPPRPGANVLLITIDTLRADHLSRLQLRPHHSAEIDRLPRRACCSRTRSRPSRTRCRRTRPCSRPPIRRSTASASATAARISTPTRPRWPRCFQRAGYQTAAFMSNPILRNRFGLEKGFDLYADDS
jgi:hypothetical protein